jgi:trehalose 6-phosphate phosphatase
MPSLPPIEGDCAFFFDFDGTLAEIAAHPEAVEVVHSVPAALQALRVRASGAVAVISGRPVAEIDQHLRPLELPAAGVHGAERRRADGSWERVALPDTAAALAWLEPAVAPHPALRLERKPGALALHYRGADALEADCLAMMEHARRLVPDTVLMHGKKVIELKPAGADKGRAVDAFMAEPPFAGRRPWFFGDDVTDEAAFAAVQARGGVTVKIGEGETTAAWRLPDPAALRAWLVSVTSSPAGEVVA